MTPLPARVGRYSQLLFVACLFANELRAQPVREIEPEHVLTLMRANDAQFDHIWISYFKSGSYQRRRPVTATATDTTTDTDTTPAARPAMPEEIANVDRVVEETLEDIESIPPERIAAALEVIRSRRAAQQESFTFHYDEELVLWWPDLAGQSEPSPQMEPRFADESVLRKWRSVGTEIRQLRGLRGTPDTVDWFLEVAREPAPVNSFQEEALWLKFALGVGYGQRIQSLDSIEQIDGGRYRLRGRMQVWWADESTFELDVDEHWVVRRARLECNVDDNITLLSADTRGTWEGESFVCAGQGDFERMRGGAETPSVSFGVVLNEVQTLANVDDERISRLMHVSAPENVDVNVFDYTQPSPLDRAAPPLDPPGEFRSFLIWMNAIVIVIVAILLWRRTRARRKVS